MGQHVWLLLATIVTELLTIVKWSQGQFPEPLPTHVRWAWTVGAGLLVLYPTMMVSPMFALYVPYNPSFSSRFGNTALPRRSSAPALDILPSPRRDRTNNY